MKTCRELTERAGELVDGEAAGPEWDEIRQHLERCPPCVEYVRQMGLTVELLRRLPRAESAEAREQLLALYAQWKAGRSD